MVLVHLSSINNPSILKYNKVATRMNHTTLGAVEPFNPDTDE